MSRRGAEPRTSLASRFIPVWSPYFLSTLSWSLFGNGAVQRVHNQAVPAPRMRDGTLRRARSQEVSYAAGSLSVFPSPVPPAHEVL